MRNLKKILALVLSLMMVLSVMVTASATDFADDADITNKEAVEVMSALGILSGSQGKFAPKGTLTREQAAKIIAFVKLGADTDALLKGTGSALFADVTSGWAYDYISYCANEGIISGYTVNGAKNFGPKGTLTGYQFGKMVLVAAGIEGTYTGSGWEVNVATALKKANLLTGLETLVLSANVTREQAAQLAFNAMHYSTTASVTGYYFDVDGYRDIIFSTRSEAMVFGVTVDKANLTADKIEVKKDNSGSILATTWKTIPGSYTDDLGHVSRTWVVDKSITGTTEDVTVIAATEAPKYTFTATAAVDGTNADTLNAGLNTALGITKTADKVAVSAANKVLVNGAAASDWTNAAPKVGDKVEVYLSAGSKAAVEKIIVTRETVVQANVAANPDTTEAHAGKYAVELAGVTIYADKGEYTDDAYYLVVTGMNGSDKTIVSAELAKSVTGKVTAKGTGYVKLGADKYTFVTDVALPNVGDTKVLYLTSAGNVALVTEPDGSPVAAETVVYVVDFYELYTAEVPAQKNEFGEEVSGTGSAARYDLYAQVVGMDGKSASYLVATSNSTNDATSFASAKGTMKALVAPTGSSKLYTLGTATTAVKVSGLTNTSVRFNDGSNNYYVNSAEYVNVIGSKGALKVVDGTQANAVTNMSSAWAVFTGETTSTNKTVTKVFYATATAPTVDPDVYYNMFVAADTKYAEESSIIKKENAEAGTATPVYTYTVYVDGVAKEILTYEKTITAGLNKYKIDENGVYVGISAVDGAYTPVVSKQVTNVYGSLLSVTDGVTDFDVTGVTVVDLRTGAEADGKLDTDCKVSYALYTDSTVVPNTTSIDVIYIVG